MQADILGIPVLISANEETTALGAATSAGVGSGLSSNPGEGGEALLLPSLARAKALPQIVPQLSIERLDCEEIARQF
ncbi:MAG: hypothetical protein J7M39_13935 [Anaerolineae bacterium]|nr:hypothetical protein [Anaerolineae bacterium]